MCIFALDIGGTNIRAAVVNGSGKFGGHVESKTPANLGPEHLLLIISELYHSLGSKIGGTKRFEAAAIAVPAPAAEDGDGILRKVPNLPYLEGMSLRRPLIESLGIPVIIENDATAAAIGESWLGISRGVQTSIMLTLGTGIGGGLIIGGQPFRGADGSAGEIGHICVDPTGIKCGCGSQGCVEQYASAQAILRMAAEIGLKARTAEDVFMYANAGDASARRIFSEMGRYLGIVAAGLINTLNPDMLVFGGKVSRSFPLFGPRLRSEVRKRAFPEPARRCRIVSSKLGDNAGLLGVARSAILRAAADRHGR